jgi:predicted small lipoprotein YifL
MRARLAQGLALGGLAAVLAGCGVKGPPHPPTLPRPAPQGAAPAVDGGAP